MREGAVRFAGRRASPNRDEDGGPGLLLLSEVAYPAWRAYVDGEPREVLTADHLLRAVPIPAGERTVELRFESRALRFGVMISLVAFLGLLGLLAAAAGCRHRQ